MTRWRVHRCRALERSVACAAALGLASIAVARPGFVPLPAGFTAYGISGNGLFVVGAVSNMPARWSAASGVQLLTSPTLPGGLAWDASSDGSVIVGLQGFRWTPSSITILPTVPGYTNLWAKSVSADGAVVFGTLRTTSANIYYAPYKWTEAGGLELLWSPVPGFGRELEDASGDGQVAVGRYQWYDLFAGGVQYGSGWRWTSATGIVPLAIPAGYTLATPVAISKDGQTIVGYTNGPSGSDAFRWAPDPQMIAPPPGGASAVPFDVSADGSVIVGGSAAAWVWTDTKGTRDLRQLLLDAGVTSVSGWSLQQAGAVSDDGSVVAGIGLNPLGQLASWVAYLDDPCYPDCNTDGALTVADFGCFQTKFVAADPYADCNTDGALTVADFGCFQTRFVQGCP